MSKSDKGFVLTAVIVMVVLGVVIVAAIARITDINSPDQDDNSAQTDSSANEPLSGLKGVSVSPQSYGPQDFNSFFKEAGEHNDLVSWAGPWTDIDADNSPPATVAVLAERNNYRPMIITSTHGEANGTIAPTLPMTEANKERFVETLASFAKKHNPPLMGIGNEINRIYDHDPQQYQQFVQWFNAAAAAVKQASPSTEVFTVFQYENLNGLNGGLFGGVNNQSDTDWQLIEDFGAADLIVFTTYPYLVYQTPADIPDDYYARISSYTDKPIAFSEVGWPSADTVASWPSSPQEQSAFIRRFDELTNPIDIKFATWPFLYDQDFGVPFNDIGLIDDSGEAKPAYQVWKDASF